MAYIKIPRGWEIPEREATPEHVYFNRRKFMKTLGIAGAGALFLACGDTAQERKAYAASMAQQTAASPLASLYPAKRNDKYKLDRKLTDEADVEKYNNFYEFTEQKDGVWKLVDKFQTRPWQMEITGLVRKPWKGDMDDLIKMMPLEERLYRHRCVEAWAMAVPWTGFQFSKLIDMVEPLPSAQYVKFVSFNKPDEAPGLKNATWYPWPYFEALTMDEAMNELTFGVTGIYGHELPKQNGAPFRMALPWKYGYKSPKSIVNIEFTDVRPKTFWNVLAPDEYSWTSNVNPNVPHPRWSQATERLIDTGDRVPTQMYNGYGEFVAALYQ
jgi:sulfoxide reductase catalytic subunit YedY